MLSFIVAFDPNQGIGIKGSLPWHIRDDLKLFKQNTLGKNIVMGQTTYENLPRKLTDRRIFVVSNDEDFHDDEVTIIRDLIPFLQLHQNDEEEYFICGGASIYRQSYPYCNRAFISFVKKEYEVDTHFGVFDFDDWFITKEVDYDEFIYRELIRRKK
jgi:dihydrofolate reductase